MGKKNKKKGGKDGGEGKAALKKAKQNKMDQKQAKKLKKKLGNVLDRPEEEEDIDVLLDRFKQEQEDAYKVTEEVCSDPPGPRVNGSLVTHPTNNELILFAGEFYDQGKCLINNDLYRYSIDKNEWKKITSPNTPGPRCSHQCVVTEKGLMFLFGGEYASPSETQFFHYKDFWVLDLKTNAWEKLEMKRKPSARSGHRMVIWKHFIVLFGGFYDTYVETKYFDDLWLFDLKTLKWQCVEIPLSQMKPSKRSGFQLFSYDDHVVLYGGYCKHFVKGEKPKGIVHTDVWTLKMDTDPKLLKWERRKRSGFMPSPRSGSTGVMYKHRALLFGGVYDDDISEERMLSTCYNDMHALQLDTLRWFPMSLKKSKRPISTRGSTSKLRSKKKTRDLDLLFDGEKSSDDEGEENTANVAQPYVNDTGEAIPPCPRYNTMLAVHKNTLFVLGGVLEVGDKEFTLDDFYTLSLTRMDYFGCLRENRIPVSTMMEASESDDDEGDDDDDDDDDDEEDECLLDETEGAIADTIFMDNEENLEDDKDVDMSSMAELSIQDQDIASSSSLAIEKEGNGSIEVEKVEAIDPTAHLITEAEKEAALHEPLPGETLKVYFDRTKAYWSNLAYEACDTDIIGVDGISSGKTLRKDGFALAQQTYMAMKPKLDEILKKQQQAQEDGDIDLPISVRRSGPKDDGKRVMIAEDGSLKSRSYRK